MIPAPFTPPATGSPLGTRLRFGLRLLPGLLVGALWGTWIASIALYFTAPAWLQQVPNAMDAYRTLDHVPGVVAGFTAALLGAIDAEGDRPGILHTLPQAGLRLWAERLVLAAIAFVLADVLALAGAKSYLPLPWGPALGTLVPPTLVFTSLGFLLGSFAGSLAGMLGVALYWLAGITGSVAGLDPLLGTQVSANAALVGNRWTLGMAALVLTVLSAIPRRHPDRRAAWLRVVRPELPGGWRSSVLAELAAAVVGAGIVGLVLRPLWAGVPPRPLVPAGTVQIQGTPLVAVGRALGDWNADVTLPVRVPPLDTLFLVKTQAYVQEASVGRVQLLSAPLPPGVSSEVPAPNGQVVTTQSFAGRTLGWIGGGGAVLHLVLSLSPPLVGQAGNWLEVQVDGGSLGSIQLRWPAGTGLAPAGAVACGNDLCWSGPLTNLRLVSVSGGGGQ